MLTPLLKQPWDRPCLVSPYRLLLPPPIRSIHLLIPAGVPSGRQLPVFPQNGYRPRANQRAKNVTFLLVSHGLVPPKPPPQTPRRTSKPPEFKFSRLTSPFAVFFRPVFALSRRRHQKLDKCQPPCRGCKIRTSLVPNTHSSTRGNFSPPYYPLP